MKPERIAELRELCEKATPGPWADGFPNVIAPETEDEWPRRSTSCLIARCAATTGNASSEMQNIAFIAAARTALPEALDEIERLQEDVKGMKTLVGVALKAGSDTVKEMRAYMENHDVRYPF